MACLLESGINRHGEQYVKMHDVIRDMATWITRDHGRNENKLLVIEKNEDISTEMISKLGEAERVSLWGKLIRNIQGALPACSQLEILLVRNTTMTLVPRGFFHSACLTVLDMSYNKDIQLFLEDICNLICLRYLNLSGTGVCELPRDIKNLTRLRWLLLDETSMHFLIPARAIGSLPLNVFSWWMPARYPQRHPQLFSKWKYDIIRSSFVCYNWDSFPGQSNEKEIIEEFECMQHLTELSIFVSRASSALKIFQSPNLQRSIRRVGIICCQDLTNIVISYSPTVSGVFSHLEMLYLKSCPVLREMEITQIIRRAPDHFCFPSLVHVIVQRCGLVDLSWLVCAPKLSTLRVLYCDSLEKIIGDGYVGEGSAAPGLFSRLRILKIDSLPSLTRIYDQTLPFPQLESLSIRKCPRLRKLPLDSNSARESLNELTVDRDWWDNLDWDDDAARSIFTAKVNYWG